MNEIEVKEQVRSWCVQEGLFQEEIDDETVVFRFRVRSPGSVGESSEGETIDLLDITKPMEDGDSIIVTSGIEFDNSIMAPMKSFEGANSLMSELEMTLDFRNELYIVDYSDGVLNSIIIFEEIFDDGLTKDRLMRAMRGVNKTLIVALWVLKPLLSELGTNVDEFLAAEETEIVETGETPTPQVEDRPAGVDGTVDIQFCPNCKHEINKDNKFCTNCGIALMAEEIEDEKSMIEDVPE